jgi:hypothetical protein
MPPGPLCALVQLHPHPQDAADEPRDGGRYRNPSVVDGRCRQAGRVARGSPVGRAADWVKSQKTVLVLPATVSPQDLLYMRGKAGSGMHAATKR